MKNKELYLILAAGLVAFAAILAYDTIRSQPEASNFYMATDMVGKNRTSVFSPTSHVYIFFNVSDIEAGTNFQSRWYALDQKGLDSHTPLRTIDYAYREGDENKLFFQLSSIGNWPVGDYKVEVYLNNAKVGEQTFSVQ